MSDDSTIDDSRAIAERVPESTRLAARYEQGALLGEGGMGEVRECRDRVLDRTVGLKLVRRDRSSRELEARFVREACVQAQLEHPGVVPVYEVGRAENGAAFFTMRRVAGLTLDEVLEKKRRGDPEIEATFTRHRLLTAFAQICLTVDYAHSRGVLHRDIKPSNVMFGDFGEVYVLDWGLAKITARSDFDGEVTGPTSPAGVRARAARMAETEAGATMGTPMYMPPEQMAGRSLDARADVFALGCILFEILTLETLFDEEMLKARFGRQNVSWDARPSVRAPHRNPPPEFDRICVRATADAMEKRYPSARVLHDVIEAWLGGERDLELRKQKAIDLLDRAEASRISDPDAALHDVNRALALAPGEPRGLVLLVQLLEETPGALERGRSEAASESIERLRRHQPLGALLFAGPWVTLVPAMLAVRGARSLPLALLPIVAWVAAGIAMLVDHRMKTQDKVSYPTWITAIALATTTVLIGPFYLLPALAMTVVANHVLVAARNLRQLTIVLGCFALIVPSVLAWSGIHDVYRFTEATSFRVLPIFASLRAENIGPVITLGHACMAVGSWLFASRFRDEIDRARLESVLTAWHLGRLLPPEIGTPAVVRKRDDEPRSDTIARILDTAIDVESRGGATLIQSTRIADSDVARAGTTGDPLAVEGPRYVPSPSDPSEGLLRDELIQRDVLMTRPSSADDAMKQARLDHPGVPPVYDLGEDAGGLWLTMKAVAGTRLADAARVESEAGRHRLLAAFSQVCLTVDFAHARGVVHGALDATRIVLGDFGEVYVVEWGVRDGASAPEQAGGTPANARSDVFALGAILFELLAREPLVSGDRREMVLGRYDARPSSRGATDVPPELDEICVKAAAYEPTERYESARELHDALETFLGADRDVALRRKLAADHLARAELHEKENDREEALREIGRALALAPERDAAVAMLTRLLASAPNAIPTEVAREIEKQRIEATIRPSNITSLGYVLIWLVTFPIFALIVGVRDWRAVTVVMCGWALAAVGVRLERKVPAMSLLGFVGVASTAMLFGAYFVLPAATVAMILGHVLGGPKSLRPLLPLLGLATLIVPTLLADAQVIDVGGFYGTPQMTVVIVRGALVLFQSSLHLALLVAALATMLIGTLLATTYRDVLEDMEAKNRARVHALARLLNQPK